MKTYSMKPSEIARKWYLVDANGQTIGRLATVIAGMLVGKSKPGYTPHIDGGDYVVVTNSDNMVATGKKMDDKVYYRHTQYPGGIKSVTLGKAMQKDSTQVLFTAVRGMLPVNKLRAERLARLKIYPAESHSHEAQKPQKLSIGGSK